MQANKTVLAAPSGLFYFELLTSIY